jgi:hypothetical protein
MNTTERSEQHMAWHGRQHINAKLRRHSRNSISNHLLSTRLRLSMSSWPCKYLRNIACIHHRVQHQYISIFMSRLSTLLLCSSPPVMWLHTEIAERICINPVVRLVAVYDSMGRWIYTIHVVCEAHDKWNCIEPQKLKGSDIAETSWLLLSLYLKPQ